ncbi:GTPase ObgE, partial [Treponema pallidum]
GVLRTGDGRDVILADVPGILERASQGVGLGLRFLKHLTRCAGLAFLIDLADERALHTYDLLCKELYAFSPVFETKARVLVGTKLDLPNARECLQQLRAQHPSTEVCGVSVHNRWGLDELQEAFVRLSDAGAGALRSPVWRNQAPSFMYAQLEDPVCQVRDDFGATVSLSRKRKVRG